MKRKLLILIFALVIATTGGCATTYEKQRTEYDSLGSAVAAASYAIIGEYGDNLPSDLSDKFMIVIENKMPSDYYEHLKKYKLNAAPKGWYYLLLVMSPETGKIIMFDYSCTANVDGLVYLDPDKYDLNNLDQYDVCKSQN